MSGGFGSGHYTIDKSNTGHQIEREREKVRATETEKMGRERKKKKVNSRRTTSAPPVILSPGPRKKKQLVGKSLGGPKLPNTPALIFNYCHKLIAM